MNEKDIKIALDQLTAMSEFALDLRVKLTALLDAGKDAPAEVVKEVKQATKEVVKDAKKADAKAKEAVAVVSEPVKVDLDKIIADYELSGMKIGELREFLDGYEIEYPEKAKKPELVQILAQAIADGRIPEDGDNADAEEAEPVSNEAEEVDADEDAEEVDEYDASEERIAAENKVEDDIRKNFPKKLKVSNIKKFLKTYYDGDAEMADLDEFEDEQLLEMYIEIQSALVDDEGEVHAMEEAYYRNDKVFCCGKEVVEMENTDNVYCEICGNEYGA